MRGGASNTIGDTFRKVAESRSHRTFETMNIILSASRKRINTCTGRVQHHSQHLVVRLMGGQRKPLTRGVPELSFEG